MALTSELNEEQPLVTERGETRLTLSPEDIEYLEGLDHISVTRHSEHEATIGSTRYIGVIGLPSEQMIKVEPKLECGLLYFLAYIGRIDDEIVRGTESGVLSGESFVDLVARLYLQELDHVLQRGLHREYRTQERSEKYLQGSLNLERQLRTNGSHATRFECEYDDLTYQTPANQVILQATNRLQQLVDDEALLGELRRCQGMLRQRIEPKQLTSIQREGIRLSRLNAYYENILELSQLVLDQSFFHDVGASQARFQTLLINIESLFEDVVFCAVDRILTQHGYLVENNRVGHLVEGDAYGVRLGLEPDFTVRNRDTKEVVLVGDMKWKKTDKPGRSDLYQLASYQAKFGTPGMLVYPAQDGVMVDHYTFAVDDAAEPQGPLRTIEVPTTESEYDQFVQSLEETLEEELVALLQPL